jgi:uncharacterized delta-60 repeat protein
MTRSGLAFLALALVAVPAVTTSQGSSSRGAGFVAPGPDGTLLIASGARINQRAGTVDRIGSFFVGLGGAAPDFDSAALSLMRFTPQAALDARFGNGGVAMTPLLPLRNRHRATVTALAQDAAGRSIVVGFRDQSTALDANFLVIIAARYAPSGVLDTSFGDRGIVETRVDRAGVTQAFAAAVDAQGRLLLAGYNGGRTLPNQRGSSDDWSIRTILLRYTPNGALDPAFGDRGVAAHQIDPSGQDRQSGRDYLRYDYQHTKAAGLVLDRQGRALVAASNGEALTLLMRYAADGRLDPTFGNAGIVNVHASAGAGFSISSLMWDTEGRLLAAGTRADQMVLVRYRADGVFDAAFGARGVSSTPIDKGHRVSAALCEQDGHLLVVASGENGVQLARFDADGVPDKDFGTNGTIHSAAGRRMATRAGLAIDATGIASVAALSDAGILVVRYNREGPIEQTFRSTPTTRH